LIPSLKKPLILAQTFFDFLDITIHPKMMKEDGWRKGKDWINEKRNSGLAVIV